MKKIIILITVFVLFCGVFCACAGNNTTPSVTDSESVKATDSVTETEEEKTSLTIKELAAEIDKVLSNSDKLSEVDKEYIEISMMLNTDLIKDFVLKIQVSGSEADMYGVFETASKADAGELGSQIDGYLAMMRENLADFNYMPGENVKFENAKAVVKDNYVIFVVAETSERESAEALFNNNF